MTFNDCVAEARTQNKSEKEKYFLHSTKSINICNISVQEKIPKIYFDIEYLMRFFLRFASLNAELGWEGNLIILTSNIVSVGQIKSNNETC